jgi:molybdopterin converting factor small subunit
MMTVNIRIPTPLRKYTDGQDQVSVEGSTVGEALANLTDAHPEIESRIFDDSGTLRRFVNVFANDEDIRFQDSLDTGVSEGDQISIVPAIAGG